MVFDYSLHSGAKEDLDEAIKYYSDINQSLTQDLLIEFYQTIDVIVKNPNLFPITTRKFRKASLTRFPYKIFYTVQAGEIIVLAFAHHKRKPGYWKKRK